MVELELAPPRAKVLHRHTLVLMGVDGELDSLRRDLVCRECDSRGGVKCPLRTASTMFLHVSEAAFTTL